MNLSVGYRLGLVAGGMMMILQGCDRPQEQGASGSATATDSMGVAPRDIATVTVRSKRNLVESSAAAMSASQPGVLFTINDSGNDAILFAVDTTGADRGVWRVKGATNIDWEATSVGPCASDPAPRCVYIGDIGDNDNAHPTRVIYRFAEPSARDSSASGEVTAERVTYTYGDGRYDVEAMYVARNGDVFLITKQPLHTRSETLRPALVFRVAATAWSSKTPVVAQLVDSLSLVPGSAPLRTITDASLSPDGKHLAVRTYTQVYIYATNPADGMVNRAIKPALCDLVPLGESQGEGITWANDRGRLVFSSEGHDAPLHLASCPLPD